jgi:hypothetical protein
MASYLAQAMKRTLPLLAALVLAGGSATAEDLIKPGYWEMTNKLLSPIKQTKVEKRCITPAEVTKFMSGPSNKLYVCTYPTRTFANGTITLKGSCVSKKSGRKVALDGWGVYTPDTMTVTASIETELYGLNLAGKAQTDARRIGDVCPTPVASK